MSKSRQRLSDEVFERLFKHVVQLCKETRLISGDYYFLDSSIIRADASKESFRTKLLKTEKDYLEGLQEEDKPRNNFRGHIFDGTVDPDRMGKRRRKAKKNDRLMSSTDPDAELVSRGGSSSLPAYKAHFCVDRRRRAIRRLLKMISRKWILRSPNPCLLLAKPHTVVADSHYRGIEGLKYFQVQSIQTCINPRIHHNSEGRFRNIDLKIDRGWARDGMSGGASGTETNEQPVSDPISLAEAAVQRMCSQKAVHAISPWEDCQPL